MTFLRPDESLLLTELLEQEVVLDLQSMYVCLGRLAGYDHRYLVIEEADVHDLRETTTTREKYILDSKNYGIRANRSRVLINLNEVVAISLLQDVTL